MKKKNSTAQRKKVKFDNKHLNDLIIKKVYLTFKKLVANSYCLSGLSLGKIFSSDTNFSVMTVPVVSID